MTSWRALAAASCPTKWWRGTCAATPRDRSIKALRKKVFFIPSCLEENFKVLLDHPRLIEFENKCAYFRGRINKEEDHHHSGSVRLNVRRDCVFEDSFHQLRHRTTEEMRGRLNVQFQGEDGVDAGWLTRNS